MGLATAATAAAAAAAAAAARSSSSPPPSSQPPPKPRHFRALQNSLRDAIGPGGRPSSAGAAGASGRADAYQLASLEDQLLVTDFQAATLARPSRDWARGRSRALVGSPATADSRADAARAAAAADMNAAAAASCATSVSADADADVDADAGMDAVVPACVVAGSALFGFERQRSSQKLAKTVQRELDPTAAGVVRRAAATASTAPNRASVRRRTVLAPAHRAGAASAAMRDDGAGGAAADAIGDGGPSSDANDTDASDSSDAADEDAEDGADEDDEDDEDDGESPSADYFHRQGRRAHATTDNTLSKLPRLSQQVFQAALAGAPTKHAEEHAQLAALYARLYPQWRFEASQGYNLVFYGYGSKQRVVNRFAQTAFPDHYRLVVNGFMPSVSLAAVLGTLQTRLIGYRGVLGSVTEQVARILAWLSEAQRRLVLVVHTMDGARLRTPAVQVALARLAASPRVTLLATIDHIHAPLLWDARLAAPFRWLWHDCTTLTHYTTETSFEDRLMMQAADRTLQGMAHVIGSLPRPYQQAFFILVRAQAARMAAALTEGGDGDGDGDGDAGARGRGRKRKAASDDAVRYGLTHTEWMRLCTEQLVGNATSLRACLTELKDHDMVTVTSRPAGDLLHIPLDAEGLQELLAVEDAVDA